MGGAHLRALSRHRLGHGLDRRPLGEARVSLPRGVTPGAVDLLDEGLERVTRAWGAVGAFWMLALPARVALVELILLATAPGGRSAPLLERSYGVLALGLLTVYGRVALGRALSARPPVPPDRWRILAVPPGGYARAVTASLAVLLIAMLLGFTVLAPLALLPLLGLVAVAPGERPLTLLSGPGRLLGLHLLLLPGLLVVAVNLHGLVSLVATALSSVLPGDPQRLARALALQNPRYLALLLGSVSLCIEPVWLGALTAHVEAARARTGGEDLRVWLEELRARAPRRAA